MPKPNAFAVEVTTFSSTSAAKGFFAGFQGASGAKKVTFDSRTAHGVVGNGAALFYNGSQGDLAVLNGKIVLNAMTETKAAATTTSFLNSLKILS